jgi:hypothetical protein
VRAIPDDERGPDPRDPATRRRNVRTLLAVAALVALAAVLPGTCRRMSSPDITYATAAEGAADERLPRFIPAAATGIHLRHDPADGRRIVRFDYDPAREEELVAGMRPVEDAEKERIPVPASGWASWFPINDRTLGGRQGEYLRVWEVPASVGGGWLALDPRTRRAYHWSPGGR